MAYRLHNFHEEQAAQRGRSVVRLNLDETRVQYYIRSGVGNVVIRRLPNGRRARPRQLASKGDQRAAMTHVGLVCDNKILQGRLPQIFLASDRLVPQREILGLEANLPPNSYLVRGVSSWNNADRMVWIVKLIGRVLKAFAPSALPILSMDASRVHLHESVLRECSAWGIHVVIIPPRLTWLIQPLDTHVFASMKTAMRDAYQARVGRSGGRALSTKDWVDTVTNSIYCFLRRGDWARAFDHNGFGSRQEHLSQRVLDGLRLDRRPAILAAAPSVADIWLSCGHAARA